MMLQTLHAHMPRANRSRHAPHGTVGFLMNGFSTTTCTRLAAAKESLLNPLLMRATDVHGRVHLHHAINEVALFRQTNQAAHLRILIDERERMAELSADGILVATPAGSTAYNLSPQGPILPINAALLALTPISAFRRGAGAAPYSQCRLRGDRGTRGDKRPSRQRPAMTVRDVNRVE
jgi:NAD+ kinase